MNTLRAFTGWRINLVTRNHHIFGFDDSGLTRSATCHPAPKQHNLVRAAHKSPHPRCECGWRIITDPEQFQFFDTRGRHWWRDRVAVKAETVGATLRGVDTGLTADPPATIRARRIRWIPDSPIVVPGRLSELAAPLSANYPGRVVVLPSLDWSAFADTVAELEDAL